MKTDLKREVPGYIAKHGAFEIVEVPPLRYLAIDGHGDPNTSVSYRDAVATLFTVAYKLKFLSKREFSHDYGVMPLETLWHSDAAGAFEPTRDKSRWRWTALNLIPEWVPSDLIDRARTAATGAPALDRLRVEELEEGGCVQVLHIGSYDDETPVLDELHHRIIPDAGLVLSGAHHEIYLNDARRTNPAKLRTILRQPVAVEPSTSS
ncbi:GyrI-like domain-containing protein [Microbacterium oxydans]|uniref:GyrI-like domain-containing protein n=1 Tax=Microbacterium oxydans TaxID=82380 RepID=UPI003640BC9B